MQGVWMMLKVRMNYWLWKWKCVCSGRYERLNGGGSGRNAWRKLNKLTHNQAISILETIEEFAISLTLHRPILCLKT